jgi:hypothetical protein
MAGAIGVLCADSDGGIESRSRVFDAIGGGGLPGPTGGFGLACPGIIFRLLALAVERVVSRYRRRRSPAGRPYFGI